MMPKLLRGALRLDPLRLALVVLSTAMGSGIAGALGAVGLQIQDRLAAELRSFGANVVGLAPLLTAAASVSAARGAERALLAGVWFDRKVPRPGGEGELRAGLVPLFPFWEIDGRWPA